MVGALAQLHEHVEHARLVRPHRVEHVDVLLEDVGVPFALHVGEPDEEFNLALGRQVLLNVRLEPSQQKRSEDLMKLCEQVDRIAAGLPRLVNVEPRVERGRLPEDVR